ncbi:MAG: hypothetical protein Q4A42_07235 [Tissierellia bacterium]|nr:hypothetical protein [Tissierellia bacterium]
MKLVKDYIILTIITCLILLSLGCKKQDNFSDNNDEVKTEMQASARNEEHSENNEDVFWKEVNENGVDENLLIKSIDEETLTYIAQQLQDLCIEIDEKGKKDKNYWLTGQWNSDIVHSKQYSNVVSLDKKAMKPLFLIIYKSEHSGMYEWACSKALDEISDFDFTGKNDGAGWSNSKEFLEMFIDKIIEQRK